MPTVLYPLISTDAALMLSVTVYLILDTLSTVCIQYELHTFVHSSADIIGGNSGGPLLVRVQAEFGSAIG